MMRELDPEYVTVGGLLLAPQLLARIRGWLGPDDFEQAACQEVYAVLLEMAGADAVIDPVTVLGQLRRQGRLNRGGFVGRELVAMVEAVPTPAATLHYARLVLETSVFRTLEQVGLRLAQLGRNRHGAVADVLATAAAMVNGLDEQHHRWQDAHRVEGEASPVTAHPRDANPTASLTLPRIR